MEHSMIQSDDGRSNVGHHSNTTSTKHRDNQGDNFNFSDFLSSQQQPDTDHDFDPGNRLEVSGFNADDASAINDKGSNSDPFGGIFKKPTMPAPKAANFKKSLVKPKTVADDDFFANDEALAMLNDDEDAFQKDNVFIQNDAMDRSSNDSWSSNRCNLSVESRSWMEDNMSMGSYMRGGTEALGTLDGKDQSRPDFGMKIKSPPKVQSAPIRLIEEDDIVFERIREYGPSELRSREERSQFFDTNIGPETELQGTLLDRRDYNLEHASVQVDKGLEQLQQAETYHKKHRKMYCIMILAVVDIVMIIILIAKKLAF